MHDTLCHREACNSQPRERPYGWLYLLMYNCHPLTFGVEVLIILLIHHRKQRYLHLQQCTLALRRAWHWLVSTATVLRAAQIHDNAHHRLPEHTS